MFGISVIPGMLKIFNRPENEKRRCLFIILDIVAAILQISAVIIWPITIQFDGTNEKLADMWPITISLLLISVHWWENCIDKHHSLGFFGDFLYQLQKQIKSTRSKTTVVTSLYKIVISFGFMVLWLVTLQGYTTQQLFDFSIEDATCRENQPDGLEISLKDYPQLQTDWIYVWLVQAGSALVCYLAARVACKVRIQIPGFSLPLLIAPLVTFGLLITACELWNASPLMFGHVIPTYLWWSCYPQDSLVDAAVEDSIWMTALWWFSLLIITRHIWVPRAERLATTER